MWCSWSKLMKFLVLLVKFVKFVVLLVICRLCRRKITAGQIPQSVGSAQLCWEARLSFLCISFFVCRQFIFVIYSISICLVFNKYLSYIRLTFVSYSIVFVLQQLKYIKMWSHAFLFVLPKLSQLLEGDSVWVNVSNELR